MNSALQKIVAIGGGEIRMADDKSPSGYSSETLAIDRHILELTGKKDARLLFIPTASGDSDVYTLAVNSYFEEVGFSSVSSLKLSDKSLTKQTIRDAILAHDAIYVGGGDTMRMMKAWRRAGVDQILKEALEKGIVLSGLSAGSICWFKNGISDSKLFNHSGLIVVKGLGFLNTLHSPHYSKDSDRHEAVKNKLRKDGGVAICLENCTSIIVEGSKYRILTSKPDATAYRAFWRGDDYIVEPIKADSTYRTIDSLLSLS